MTVGYLVMAACVGSFALACNTSPGVVRPAAAGRPQRQGTGDEDRGVDAQEGKGGGAQEKKRERGGGGKHAGLYPYDGVVFVEGFCNTCQVDK